MLKNIDLSKSHKHEHPDINIDKHYIVKINGEWFLGMFNKQWFGLNFAPWINGQVGIQFDAPGFNCSNWEKVIEIDLDKLENVT
jgi:hypothetical protein